MEKSSEDQEQLKELGRTSLLLASMIHSKVTKQTASDLRRMRKRFLDESGPNPDGKNQSRNQENLDRIDENSEGYFLGSASFIEKIKNGIEVKPLPFGQSIDGLKPPKLPPIERLRSLIEECSDPFEKQLTVSDLEDSQSRLSIPKDLVQRFLLPLINPWDEDLVEGIAVTVYDRGGNAFPMVFSTWSNNKMHVLKKGWKNFYHANELVPHQDWITTWMFRHSRTRKLCFAIMARRFPINELLKRRTPTIAGKKRKFDEEMD